SGWDSPNHATVARAVPACVAASVRPNDCSPAPFCSAERLSFASVIAISDNLPASARYCSVALAAKRRWHSNASIGLRQVASTCQAAPSSRSRSSVNRVISSAKAETPRAQERKARSLTASKEASCPSQPFAGSGKVAFGRSFFGCVWSGMDPLRKGRLRLKDHTGRHADLIWIKQQAAAERRNPQAGPKRVLSRKSPARARSSSWL